MDNDIETSASSWTIFCVIFVPILFCLYVVIQLIRPWYPVQVECWFCGQKTKVPFGNKNCWDCPKCEQYNGFDQDGGYNKDIPAQYNEDMNYGVVIDGQKTSKFDSASNILCRTCSDNQQLKIKQLAEFVPFDERNFDTEVELFKSHLEYAYRLCPSCERDTRRVLAEQNSLLYDKLKRFASHSPKSYSPNQSELEPPVSETYNSTLCISRALVAVMSLLLLMVAVRSHVTQIISPTRDTDNAVTYSDITLAMYDLYLRCAVMLQYATEVFLLSAMLLHYVNVYCTGRHRLLLSDSVCCFAWLVMLYRWPCAPHDARYLRDTWGVCVVCVLCLSSVWSLCATRPDASRTPIRITRKSCLNNSSMSNSSCGSSFNNTSHIQPALRASLGYSPQCNVPASQRSSPHTTPSPRQKMTAQPHVAATHHQRSPPHHTYQQNRSPLLQNTAAYKTSSPTSLSGSHNRPHNAGQSSVFGRQSGKSYDAQPANNIFQSLFSSNVNATGWGVGGSKEAGALDLDTKLETMSIGSQYTNRSNGQLSSGHCFGPAIFSSGAKPGSNASVINQANDDRGSLSSLRVRRPLISPARFTPQSQRSTTAQKPASGFSAGHTNSIFSSHSTADDNNSITTTLSRRPLTRHVTANQSHRERDSSREASSTEDDSISHVTGSSLCPVDSTNNVNRRNQRSLYQKFRQFTAQIRQWNPFYVAAILLSVVLNVTMFFFICHLLEVNYLNYNSTAVSDN